MIPVLRERENERRKEGIKNRKEGGKEEEMASMHLLRHIASWYPEPEWFLMSKLLTGLGNGGGGQGFVMTYKSGRIKYILKILITNVSLTVAKNSAGEREQFRQGSQAFFFRYDKGYPENIQDHFH